MLGVWQLSEPRDLFDKLARELDRMRLAPHDADHAFNFFVTAESLVDWSCPGGRSAQRALRESETLLMAVSHLANSAKHYKLSSHHKAVDSTHQAGANPVLVLYSLAKFPDHPIKGLHLLVHLKGKAAVAFGDSVDAIELAEKVLALWSKRSQPH